MRRRRVDATQISARTSHASPTPNSMSLLYATEDVPNRDPLHGNGSSMISYEVLRHLPSDVAWCPRSPSRVKQTPDEIRARCDTVVLLQCRGPRQASIVSALSQLSIGAAASHGEARRAISRLGSWVRRCCTALDMSHHSHPTCGVPW